MIQQNKHNISSGEVFTFRNSHGYEWSARVTRVTDSSVFSNPLDHGSEHRESLNTWNARIESGRLVSRVAKVRCAEFDYVDDIANELDIDASEVTAQIAKYGVNGSKLDRSNGIWFDSNADRDTNDQISRVHNRYDEERSEEGIPDYRHAEADGIQVGPWNAEIGSFAK